MNQDRKLNVAVVGATGAVGEAMLEILADRVGTGIEVHAVASERSLGRQVEFGSKSLDVEVLEEFDFSGIDFALFSAGGSISAEHAPRAAAAGSIVIDNMLKGNGGRGLQGLGGYTHNVITDTAGGTVNGFTEMGGNMCNGTTTCP